MKLKGKVAIVTGARRGIGQAIALELGKHGCKVIVSDIDEDDTAHVVEQLDRINVKSLAVQCDVSKKSDVDGLIAKTFEHFGKLDILVNNAGIYPFVPFLEMTEADWDKVIDVNLKSVFLTSQAAAKLMEPGSKIVNISSIASFIGYRGLVHYCASKGGMNSMVRAIALELASKKINVNAVAPGAIDTPGANVASSEELKQQTIAMIPAGRIGKPTDIANAVVFLASDQSDYMTGQTIVVDGGWTIQ